MSMEVVGGHQLVDEDEIGGAAKPPLHRRLSMPRVAELTLPQKLFIGRGILLGLVVGGPLAYVSAARLPLDSTWVEGAQALLVSSVVFTLLLSCLTVILCRVQLHVIKRVPPLTPLQLISASSRGGPHEWPFVLRVLLMITVCIVTSAIASFLLYAKLGSFDATLQGDVRVWHETLHGFAAFKAVYIFVLAAIVAVPSTWWEMLRVSSKLQSLGDDAPQIRCCNSRYLYLPWVELEDAVNVNTRLAMA